MPIDTPLSFSSFYAEHVPSDPSYQHAGAFTVASSMCLILMANQVFMTASSIVVNVSFFMFYTSFFYMFIAFRRTICLKIMYISYPDILLVRISPAIMRPRVWISVVIPNRIILAFNFL